MINLIFNESVSSFQPDDPFCDGKFELGGVFYHVFFSSDKFFILLFLNFEITIFDWIFLDNLRN